MAEVPVRTDFPRTVREIENTWIPMRDGTQLAARIWLPDNAEDDPVPAILEYLPYRKRDGTVERDHITHPYFAGFGYAGVRVDLRGSGDSEGVCLGEYLLQEQEDCLDVIDWLARQPWCSGKVGMMGISWGGFNGLQVAARNPEALGAVISLCSTDDRYADDIHFMGGTLLTDKLAWGATAFTIANTPPDPAIVGERWRDMWKERLDNNGLWMLDWFKHQRRDALYQHGSICENYADIKAPVYLVGGWADGYTNPIFRMLEHLECDKKALIGPWAHKYPHFALPGPRIGFLQECLRWWDQHLKGIDTGIMEEPQLRAWIQHTVSPSSYFEERPGHWVTEPVWHGTAKATQSLYPADGQLFSEPTDESLTVSTPENCGHAAGAWCGYGLVPDGPVDQSLEKDMQWFETPPLGSDLELLGFPILSAEVRSNVAQANLAAVLSEVDHDGKATLLSYGVLNLCHHSSHADPERLTDEPVQARVQLNVCGQKIAKGHRLRLALSSALWPVIWPSQSKATLTLRHTKLILPVYEGDEAANNFATAEGAAPLVSETLEAGEVKRERTIDYATGVETYRRYSDTGLERHAHTGLDVRYSCDETFEIHPDDPNSAVGHCVWAKTYARGDWQVGLNTSVTVQALADSWQIDATLEASDGNGVVATRSWSERIKRDCV